MGDSIAILAAHASVTLPDSISRRKIILEALANALKPAHPATRAVEGELAAIATLERLDLEIAKAFDDSSFIWANLTASERLRLAAWMEDSARSVRSSARVIAAQRPGAAKKGAR